ncbi:hypothetical protein TIFTF001_025220 [Ficus carica]|uniref:Uncharacterized protein n=1 Tax=Ficus carica TaxID=3494 RepID=A0AA88DH67_FICCA|nr:hypothetical protein TIFTF001_025220 [Ficus carica]
MGDSRRPRSERRLPRSRSRSRGRDGDLRSQGRNCDHEAEIPRSNPIYRNVDVEIPSRNSRETSSSWLGKMATP